MFMTNFELNHFHRIFSECIKAKIWQKDEKSLVWVRSIFQRFRPKLKLHRNRRLGRTLIEGINLNFEIGSQIWSNEKKFDFRIYLSVRASLVGWDLKKLPYHALMCSFFDRKQTLLKPFFDLMHKLESRARQSYFIRAHLWSRFGVSVTLAGAFNRKMVLVKFVHDRKMNPFRYGKGVLKEILSPYN